MFRLGDLMQYWNPQWALERAGFSGGRGWHGRYYEHSTELSQGMKYVLVNGRLEYDNGHLTGVTARSILRGRERTDPTLLFTARVGDFACRHKKLSSRGQH